MINNKLLKSCLWNHYSMIFKRKKVMFFLNSSIEPGASSSNCLQETHHRTQMTHQPLVAYLWESVCKEAQKNPTLDRGGENKKKEWARAEGRSRWEKMEKEKNKYSIECRTWRGPCWTRGKVWRGRSDTEKTLCSDYKTSPSSCIDHKWDRGVRSEGVKLAMGKRGGKVLFKCLSSCFSLPKSALTGNILPKI